MNKMSSVKPDRNGVSLALVIKFPQSCCFFYRRKDKLDVQEVTTCSRTQPPSQFLQHEPVMVMK